MLTGESEPLKPECMPLITMDMIKQHFSGIKQTERNIEDLEHKVNDNDDTIKLGIPDLEIKCINCDTIQPLVNPDEHGTLCCRCCERNPYVKYGVIIEEVPEEKMGQSHRIDN
jgi:hypothetical protein